MKSFIVSSLLVSLIVCAGLSPVLASEPPSDKEKLIEDYLSRAGGDIYLATEMMAKDIIILTGDAEYLEWRHDRDTVVIQDLEDKIKREEPSLLDRLGNSSLFKVGLVVIGLYIGAGA